MVLFVLADKKQEVLDFINLLWQGINPGFLSLWTLPSRLSKHVSLADPDLCAATAVALDGENQQVYFGVGARVPGLPETSRGHKTEVVAIPGIWLDIDLVSPAHVSKNLPGSDEDVAVLLSAVPLAPTAIISSGHGLHVWWLFDSPLFIHDRNHIIGAEKLAKALQTSIIDEAKRHGWHVDITSDLARVLRLPGTTNRKIPSDLRPVILLFGDGPRYRYEEFRSHFIRLGRPKKASINSSDSDLEGAQPPSKSIDEEDLIRRLALPGNPETWTIRQRILNCESLSDAGGRDAALQSACSILVFMEPDVAPEDLLPFVRPSLELWAAEPDARRTLEEEEAKALDKLTRAREDAAQKRAEAKEVEARIEATLARAAGDPYTKEELRGFCQLQRIPLASGQDPEEALQKRWVIIHANACYVLKEGRYLRPVSMQNLALAIVKDLARAPIKWSVMKADGGLRRKKIGELLEDYGSVARTAVVDLALQESWFDGEREVFYEATCPLRKLAPLEDPRIGHWLHLLGGVQEDKLLDWISTITQLDKPTCGPYFSGPKSAGKTMLAQGLARLWTTGSVTQVDQIIGAWNEDLCRCPLVLADEYLPKSSKQSSADWVRVFLGSANRALSRKYLSNTSLVGSPRLIMCANNGDLLARNEDLGGRDLDAMAIRVLYFDVPPSAVEYLRSIGGRAGTEGWIEGDGIARHALWLKEQREVDQGSRMLVEGEESSMHRRLTMNGRTASLVCEWLAKHLEKLEPSVCQLVGDRVVVGNGRYLANATAISDAWDFYIKSSTVPSTRAIGLALGNLSLTTETVRENDIRLHDLNVEMVLEEAVRCQIGDVDKLRARVMGLVSIPEPAPEPSPLPETLEVEIELEPEPVK
jgi:hypothetical protein